MTKAKEQNKVVVVFGQELEQKVLSNQELIDLIKNRFGSNLEVGKVSYYILALKHLQMISLSYASIVAIIKKLFEINGLETNTTEKCMAWYMQKIKKNKIDITEDFSNVGRKKEIINVNELVF